MPEEAIIIDNESTENGWEEESSNFDVPLPVTDEPEFHNRANPRVFIEDGTIMIMVNETDSEDGVMPEEEEEELGAEEDEDDDDEEDDGSGEESDAAKSSLNRFFASGSNGTSTENRALTPRRPRGPGGRGRQPHPRPTGAPHPPRASGAGIGPHPGKGPKICVYKAAVSSTSAEVDENVKLLFPPNVWLARNSMTEADRNTIIRIHENERRSVSLKGDRVDGLISEV